MGSNGFTLTEALVVVLIFSILVAIIAPIVVRCIRYAKHTRERAQTRDTAIGDYADHCLDRGPAIIFHAADGAPAKPRMDRNFWPSE